MFPEILSIPGVFGEIGSALCPAIMGAYIRQETPSATP